MRKHHRGRGKLEKKLSDQLEVTVIGTDRTMITWVEKDGRYSSIVIPDEVLPSLVKRLASWMDV